MPIRHKYSWESSGPRIRHFSHGAGRSNGIDGGYFRERIRYMRCGGIAVHGNLFSCHDFLSSDTFSLSYIISRFSEKVKIYRKKKREIHRFRLKNFYRKQIVPVLFKRTVLKAFSFCLSGKMGCASDAGPAAYRIDGALSDAIYMFIGDKERHPSKERD